MLVTSHVSIPLKFLRHYFVCCLRICITMNLASDNGQTQVSAYSAPVTIFPSPCHSKSLQYIPDPIAEPESDGEALQHLELLMRPA